MGYVVCGGCAMQVQTANWNAGGAIPCPVCARGVEVVVFPAAMRPVAGAAPEAIVTGEEASCYNHAANRAVAACDGCGRFLCTLCDIPVSNLRVCPSCFEAGKGGVLDQVRLTERTNFDTIALALVTLPIPLCWLIIFTTPAALYFAIKHWNDPSPLFPRGKWRQWLTVAIAILQVILIVSLVVFIVRMQGGNR